MVVYVITGKMVNCKTNDGRIQPGTAQMFQVGLCEGEEMSSSLGRHPQFLNSCFSYGYFNDWILHPCLPAHCAG